ncbi:MAG: TRAP transporter small permease [Gammaproteobacteria bacterium]|nr:TRAP transporter small permease [Gammaproteobacteria bacterium]
MSLERQTVNSGLASDQGQGGPFLRWIDRLVGWIDFTGAVIVTTTLTAMFLGLFVNVVLRYALGDGITWAYEIPSILFPWMVAGGIVMAAARGRNISVTVFADLLPDVIHWLLMLAVHLTIAVISVSVMVTGERILMASRFQRLSETGIQQIWGYSSLYYAFGFVVILSALHMLRMILTGPAGRADRELSSFS